MKEEKRREEKRRRREEKEERGRKDERKKRRDEERESQLNKYLDMFYYLNHVNVTLVKNSPQQLFPSFLYWKCRPAPGYRN